jgi:hypothetical protein
MRVATVIDGVMMKEPKSKRLAMLCLIDQLIYLRGLRKKKHE